MKSHDIEKNQFDTLQPFLIHPFTTWYQKNEKPIENTKTIDSAKLLSYIPNILWGDSLITFAADWVRNYSSFAVVLLQIDLTAVQETHTESAKTCEYSQDDIEILNYFESIAKSMSGIWGVWKSHCFVFFFPHQLAGHCIKLVNDIKMKLMCMPEHYTITAGIAAYPLLNFKKEDMIANAEKALMNAHFFGIGATVVFDAITLNISADAFYQEGKIEDALHELRLAIQLDPLNVNIHNSMGVCYGLLQDYKNALNAFEHVLCLDPNEYMAFYNSGLVYMFSGDFDKALSAFKQAHECKPDIFEIAFQIGKLLMEMNDYETAITYFEKAVTLRPELGITQRYIGDCFFAQHKIKEAQDMYQKALRNNPNDAASLSTLGYLYQLQGENQEIAAMFCEQSIKILPEEGLFHQRLGMVYLKQHRIEEALDAFLNATRFGKDSSDYINEIHQQKTGNVF
ncbi:MAG: tetratricopeptide repeat protein [Desulfobacterales bacterium]|nr:tetratricopeptide repeat protein [Desulfobacterales bacterium]